MAAASSKDLQGKLAVITGANSGIGLEACAQLTARGADVVMCSRSMDKGEIARQDVIKRSGCEPNKIHLVQLDLADLEDIGSFRSRYDVILGLAKRPIDMLILNAGVMAPAERELSKQGIELQMATNVIGHFKFASIMFDLCKAAPQCRIVFVSSGAHKMTKRMNLIDLNRDQGYWRWQVYAESKLGNLLTMAKLNRLLEEKGINNVVAIGCHPGYSNTNLQSHLPLAGFANSLLAQGADRGAEPTVLAATDTNAPRNAYAGPSGFFEAWGDAKWGRKVNSAVWDTNLQDALWDKCESLTKCDFIGQL